MSIPEVLIMTGTISPFNSSFVAIKDPKERLFQYLCSLVSWIKLTSVETIIFCENSNTSYDFKKLIEFAESQGKKLEILVFDGNHISRNSKGFGEGLIMEYVFQNSKFLMPSGSFYKITGRVFVENFESIKEKHTQFDNVFVKIDGDKRWWHPRHVARNYKMYLFSLKNRGFKNPLYIYNYVLTNFYKSDIEFFKNNLLYSYKKDDGSRLYPYWLEHAYCDDLGNNFQVMLEEPRIIGRSGSDGALISGLDYDDTIKDMTQDLIT